MGIHHPAALITILASLTGTVIAVALAARRVRQEQKTWVWLQRKRARRG